ncbi:MAG TPA: HIT family protein [Steroidobacteraceae bacterium]|jgi:diadenosine tetraphosphate (Ap4A) HIT family hydrolase|nr:HIT family protein [Steroidobacteraceae bacterium]
MDANSDVWHRLSGGTDCPLCVPRAEFDANVYRVRQLTSCTLYLARDQRYRGACRAIYDRRHVNRIDELTAAEWQQLAQDLWRAQQAIVRTVRCDHLNLASLGNEVPHLHWHLIPRYRDDGRWGQPIWRADAVPDAPRHLAQPQYAALAAALNEALDAELATPPITGPR